MAIEPRMDLIHKEDGPQKIACEKARCSFQSSAVGAVVNSSQKRNTLPKMRNGFGAVTNVKKRRQIGTLLDGSLLDGRWTWSFGKVLAYSWIDNGSLIRL
ncbi:hypothetical protein K3175_05640 [Qipengyuania sp. GH1]|uniref:hypothetical protein n=1 Tax=Qipengyuania aestuarii TaxID=2867241 RepID=UPI001C87826F|nr:hypothetical protein [Qipengyuania aestuarii]MBX7535135.1 hypothetical protein [Qipengyuania aestuarii]